MRNVVLRTAVLALMLPLAAGCIHWGPIYPSLQESRTRAFEDWRESRRAEEKAETVITGLLSLQDAAKLALLHNKDLRATLEERTIAMGLGVESLSGVLPSATLSAMWRRLDEVDTANFGGVEIDLGKLNNYSGATTAAIRSAQLALVLSDEQIRAADQQTLFDTATEYYEVLLAQHLYETNREAVRSSEAHLKDVKARREQGAASDYDVLRAEVDLSNFKADMIQQKNRIHLAEARLHRVLGVSQDSDVELSDTLVYAPITPDLEEAVRIAMTNRPDLYMAELAVRTQEESVRLARSAYGPQVSGFFDYTRGRPGSNVFGELDRWEDDWYSGIRATMTLFDGFGREGRMVQEMARLRRRHVQLRSAEEQVLLEVRQAMLNLRDADEFVESQKLNLKRANEALRLAEVGYREGVRTQVEVTDARAALTRARGLYYQAIHTHTMARLGLQMALGVLGPRAGERVKEGEEQEVRPGTIEEFGREPEKQEEPEKTEEPKKEEQPDKDE
ncbi:MAG: TolC family protein [Planctomycetota bacterium]|jgi:outer membrane protein TolC